MRDNDCSDWEKPSDCSPTIKCCRTCGNKDCEFSGEEDDNG